VTSFQKAFSRKLKAETGENAISRLTELFSKATQPLVEARSKQADMMHAKGY